MEVTATGKNLTIVISSKYEPHFDWMSFASYYSIVKSLPDAKVVIISERTDRNRRLFGWTHQCDIRCFQYTPSDDLSAVVDSNKLAIHPYLILPANRMAVKRLSEGWINVLNEHPSEAKFCDKEPCDVFIQYDKCGDFVLSEWIDKNRCPFSVSHRFTANTAVERKILDLWQRAHVVYKAFGKG